jgi:hypothetical protein
MLALVLVAPWAISDGAAAPAQAIGAPVTYGPAPAGSVDAALPAWDGSINLYRTGVFTTQKTWYYCTAADVQIIRNIVRHEESHSRAAQDRYFSYMRKHMRYAIPVRHGVDPAGWTAGMRHFIDDRYRLVRSETFGSLLRSAVRSLRRTNLPVALFVDHGNHGWVLHGFTATADPAVTSDFTVTSVRVTGPLWGRQNATYGYDMRPNKKLTRAQLKDFVTRWHYAPIRMVYEGEFLSIQPIGASATTAATGTVQAATTGSTPASTATATATSALMDAGAVAGEVPVAEGAPPAVPTSTDAAVGAVGVPGEPPDVRARSSPALPIIALLAATGLVLAIARTRRGVVRRS